MKIAHLMGTLNRGGAETLVLDICRNAARAGLNLVLFHRKSGLLAENFLASGVEMIRLRPDSPPDLKYLARLRRIVVRKQIDVLHAHQVIDATYALLATAGLSTKVVLSLHGHGNRDGFLSGTMRRFAIRRSDRVLFVSQELATHYGRGHKPIKNGMVFHNGIDFSKFKTEEASYLRKDLRLKEGLMLLGTVGNFTSVRDQMTICRFLHLLKEKPVPFHFVFVGGASPAEPQLYKTCSDYCTEHGLTKYVSFLGSRSDVPAILPQLDAFVYSTVHDTFGIAVVEAIAAGIPVFVNDWKVMEEVTDDGNWAMLYRSKDEDDLLEKFMEFYRNREKYLKKAQQNASAVKERYGIVQYLDHLKGLYQTLLTL